MQAPRIALALLLLWSPSCSEKAPKLGEACKPGHQWCLSQTSALFCDVNGRWAAMTCNGWCNLGAHDAVFHSQRPKSELFVCQQDRSSEGAPCGRIYDYACSLDGKHALRCEASHRFAVVRDCPGGCTPTRSSEIECTQPPKDVDEPCGHKDELRCDPEGKRLLACVAGKLTPREDCADCRALTYVDRRGERFEYRCRSR